MKGDYNVWDLSITNFPYNQRFTESSKFLINFAILAPSSHNSQPWKFKIENDKIFLFADESRRLAHSDKNDRQLYISLGCALTNLLVAADYYGYKTTVRYLPDPNEKNLAAVIELTPGEVSKNNDHLIFQIPKRTNNRNKYEHRLPAENTLQRIKALSANDITVELLLEDKKNAAADLALQAGIEAMASADFRAELKEYVKPNTTKSPIGMPGFGMGIPTLVSFIAPIMIKYLNMNKLSKKKDEKLLKKHTPIIGIISTKDDTKLDWLKAGELYEKIALIAEQEKAKTAVWAAPIQIGKYYQELQSILKTNNRPQIFFRLGYTNKETRHSPRISTDKLLIT